MTYFYTCRLETTILRDEFICKAISACLRLNRRKLCFIYYSQCTSEATHHGIDDKIARRRFNEIMFSVIDTAVFAFVLKGHRAEAVCIGFHALKWFTGSLVEWNNRNFYHSKSAEMFAYKNWEHLKAKVDFCLGLKHIQARFSQKSPERECRAHVMNPYKRFQSYF